MKILKMERNPNLLSKSQQKNIIISKGQFKKRKNSELWCEKKSQKWKISKNPSIKNKNKI